MGFQYTVRDYVVNVRTNYNVRQFKYREEVPDKVLKKDLDWTDETDHDGYILHKGEWYHLSQFEARDVPVWGRVGVHHFGYSCGLMIRTAPDGEGYQIGYFY